MEVVGSKSATKSRGVRVVVCRRGEGEGEDVVYIDEGEL